MKLRWLLTAGFEICTENYRILIDPYITRPEKAVPRLKTKIEDIKNSDSVFISHGHYDHAIDVPEIIKNTETKIYCSQSVLNFLIHDFGVKNENTVSVVADQIIDFSPDFKVKIIKSRHIEFDDFVLERLKSIRSPDAEKIINIDMSTLRKFIAGDVFGFLFEFSNGIKIIHFGSGGYYEEELRKLPKNIDYFLAPVAGRFDCDKEIAKMADIFEPKVIIPHHYDDFSPPFSFYAYSNFDKEVKQLNKSIKVNKIEHETYVEF